MAPSTKRSYRCTLTELANFLGFPSFAHISSPLSELDIVRYVAFLFNGGLAYPSILTRLSAVTFWLRFKEWPLVTQSHAVSQALRGVRTLAARKPRSKFPITPDVLKHLCVAAGDCGLSDHDVICVRAMFLLAFHAFLRVGELCGSRHALQFSDVRIQQSCITICFPTFKFSAGRCPSVFIPARTTPWCPVRALEFYISCRDRTAAPLFLDAAGQPVTIQQFRLKLAQVDRAAGLKSWGITPHSFRVGAATSAVAIGIPEETIQRMGRWTSRAFLRYIQFQINRV